MTALKDISLTDLHPRDLKRVCVDIPTLPQFHVQLSRMVSNPRTSVPEIASLVERDQAIAARLLRVVNSALYGQRGEITSIERAIVVLGFRELRSAILAAAVFEHFRDVGSMTGLDIHGFWRHSVAVSEACRLLARRTGTVPTDEAFAAGLLHDIGKLVQVRYFPGDIARLTVMSVAENLTWPQCERRLFNTDHARIGAAVLDSWNLPPSLVEAVRCHHSPKTAQRAIRLVSLVHVADHLAQVIDEGETGVGPVTPCLPLARRRLGLKEDDLASILPELADRIVAGNDILALVS